MADIEHVNIADPNIHEPKGISTATSGEVYVADGAGSGTWHSVYTQGFEDYENSGSAIALTASTWTDLTNDGLGANTLTTYRLPGYSAIWSTSTNEFDWASAGLSLGDTVDIRFDVTFNVNTSGDLCVLRLDLAHGDPGEYTLEIFRDSFKTSGAKQVTVFTSIYMGNNITLNNPAKIAAFSDTAGDTVLLNGFYARVIPRTPVFA